ncbi:DNA repair-scaffolding protein-like [Saccoglossus kowalevskii]|uniref:DNA repair-scaffolding protein-like n=1 Tax=Saccoglossus kowalevskii TaxID=10224 RepID=A0ABM0MNY4_SACKO|nr:PREDICTED: DNA repair-scaffolding protein-like [Saccoglossus kowalevskii]
MGGYHIFFTDSSLYMNDKFICKPRPYVYVHITSSCTLLGSVRQALTAGQVVYLQDVCFEKAIDNPSHMYADVCSRVFLTASDPTTSLEADTMHIGDELAKEFSGKLQIVLPKILVDMKIKTHSLVELEGVIYGVDESTAFSWPACDVCGNERLQGGEDDNVTQLHCNDCDRSVTSPQIKMNLEVYVKCSQLKNMTVKVKLLQCTIEKLLSDSDDSEDGYDMQCILGKSLDSLKCFVLALLEESSSKKQIVLEEIQI